VCGSGIYNESIVFSGKRYGTILLLVIQKGSLRNWFYSTQAVVCLDDNRGSGEAWGLGRDFWQAVLPVCASIDRSKENWIYFDSTFLGCSISM
jgi:hypothetical protein